MECHREPLDSEIYAKGVSVFYGEKQALFDVEVNIPCKRITALIGPSG